MDDLFFEPLKYYDQVGRAAHEKNTSDYFDNLLAKSGVNADENRTTVKKYNEENENIKNIEKKISKYKTLRTLLIVLIVIGAILLLSSFGQFSTAVLKGIIMLLLGIAAIAGGIYLIVTKLNPLIKDSDSVREQHVQKADELLQLAESQMAPLNALFDDVDTFKIIEKTIPEFSFDNRFTKEHEDFLIKQHDFLDLGTEETSVTNTLAGRFAGNPFLYCKRTVHEMKTAKYEGSLQITWVETYRDSNGHLQTRTRSETLYATVVKPKPEFNENTYLGYGCQVAPGLTFSRQPQHSEVLDDKQINKKVKAGEKELKKLTQKATKTGGTFQEMTNTKFDVLFGATDRDNEVQFRVMYTPLAQQNTVDLVRSKVGYGDDFLFIKNKRYNIINSEHAQNWDMNTTPANYFSYDVDEARIKFLNFNTNYFKSIFFDFAPLFAVPAYTQEPCASFEPDDYAYNYPYYEHEIMANAIGYERFAHPESHTAAILKTSIVQKQDNQDLINVSAFSYTTEERVDYVPVRGGDGKYHNVPVPWIEYIPLNNTSLMTVEATDMTETEYISAVNDDSSSVPIGTFFHGMVAKLVD